MLIKQEGCRFSTKPKQSITSTPKTNCITKKYKFARCLLTAVVLSKKVAGFERGKKSEWVGNIFYLTNTTPLGFRWAGVSAENRQVKKITSSFSSTLRIWHIPKAGRLLFLRHVIWRGLVLPG